MKHGGGSVMIWRCMTAFGPGAWYIIEGRMDMHMYKFILEKNLVVYYTKLQFGSKWVGLST